MGIDGFDRESRVCEIKSPCVDVIFFYGFNLEREEGLYFSDYGPSLAIFYATLWEENVMIHSFWEIFCSSWFNPLDKTPDMKGVLFQCFEWSTFVESEVDEEVVEVRDDEHDRVNNLDVIN